MQGTANLPFKSTKNIQNGGHKQCEGYVTLNKRHIKGAWLHIHVLLPFKTKDDNFCVCFSGRESRLKMGSTFKSFVLEKQVLS